MYAEELLTKQGETVLNIAEILLKMTKGEKLPNNQELTQRYRVGAGTIQAALKYLTSIEAIELISRGQQGTVLSSVNYTKLLQLCGNPMVIGVMPLPYSVQFEGLATGLYKNFEKSSALLKMTYVRGGKERLKLLLNKSVDFMICSMLTARTVIEKHPEIVIVESFGSRSYVTNCGIIFKDHDVYGIKDGMRIGVDMDSYDHIVLNNVMAGDHIVEYVPIQYSDVATLLSNDVIDATFWSLDNYINATNGNIVQFTGQENEAIRDSMEGVLICREDSNKRLLLEDILTTDDIKNIQEQVASGERIPSY